MHAFLKDARAATAQEPSTSTGDGGSYVSKKRPVPWVEK